MMRKLLYSFLFFIFLHATSFGQVITLWSNDINGNNPGNTANPYMAGQIVATGITVSGISKTGVSGANGDNRYNTTGWSNNFDSGRYIEFTLTPDQGSALNLVSFAYTGQASNTANIAIRSSLDNFASNIGSATLTGTTISLSASTYQGVTGSITFRVYAWGGNGTRQYSINDFIFRGTVGCPPAPNTTGTTICVGGSGNLTATPPSTTATGGTYVFAGSWNGSTDPTARIITTSIKSSNNPSCGFGNAVRNYTATNFTVNVSGSYTFKMTDTDSFDGMAYIYSGAFTPGNCGSGTWVSGDDDEDGSGKEPKMTVNLTAGVVYTLISTTFSTNSGTYTGDYVWNVTLPAGGQINLPTISWYTASTGGTFLGRGSSFNPVGVTGSGLSNTNTPGTYTFHATLGGPTCTRTPVNFVINGNNTPTTSVGTYSFCVDSNNNQTTPNISSGQYALVNVIQGYKYTFQVGDVFSGNNEKINILDAATDLDVSPAATNTGANGAVITSWPATFSGQVKVVVSTGSCSNNGIVGTGGLNLSLVSVGNSLDDQLSTGTTDNTWRGHIYNWTSASLPPGGSSSPAVSTTTPFSTTEYAGYYDETGESITQGFGGDDACFRVYSNGVERGSIRTEQFAIRYRMKSTKTGCYMVRVRADDGVRLYVDNVKVVDQWQEQSPTTYSNVFVNLTGSSQLVLDYYENGGGNVIEFSMTPFDASSNTITAPATTTVCSGTAPGLIDGSAYQYNGGDVNPTVRFQWQSSSSASGPWANVTTGTGITSEDYTPAAITGNTTQNVTYYRRTVSSATSSTSCSYNSSPISITTNPVATLVRSGGAAAQTVCGGSAITNIVYTFGGGATGATVTNLPAGLTSNINAGALTISGTPTAGGTFTVSTTGQSSPCAVVSENGTITINPAPTLSLTSGTASPAVCPGTAITNIVYTFGGGATGVNVIGLPAGLSSNVSGNTVTISGTPTAGGNYTVATTGQATQCTAASLSGTVTVNSIHTISAAPNRSVCQNAAMSNIVMNLGGGATGATVTGLPTGVTYSVESGVVTISGTPTESGVFYYSVNTTGNSCATASTGGTITIGIGNNTITYSEGTSGSICVNAEENNETPADFIAPTGTYFNTVTFASYGTAFGSCPSFSLNSSCHASDSQSIVENDLLGNSGTIQILPSNSVFHDPCVGTFKYLRVIAYYSQAICSGTAPGTISGSDPTGNNPFSYEWQSSTSAAGPYNTISGSNSKDYTPGILTQSTYFRRIVTSGGCTSTSPILLIKVNPLPTIATTATTSEVCYGGTSASLSYTGTTGAPTTYSITWNASPANTFAPVLDASITASSISIVIPSTATANTYTGTITVKNANGCTSTGKNFTVTVLPQFTTGTISSTGQTICSGGNPSQIGSTTDASGGNGVITYQWQANGVNIASSNSKVYTPPTGLTATTTYTRYASDGTCNTSPVLSSGSWTVTVRQIETAPSIGTITDVSCLGAGSVVLENLPSGTWYIVRTGLTTPQDSFSGTGTSRTVTGLAADTYHFTIRTDDTCVSAQSSAVEIKDGSSTTWNGSIWSNGPPTSSKSVTISSTNGSPFATDTEACSLTINVPNGLNDPFVTVPAGVTLTITNAVTSNGKLVFESGASLIQNTTVQNSGEIVYRRIASVRRYDFTYWSMPVTKAGFKMKHLSPNTLADKYFYFDSAIGNWALDYNGEMEMLTGIGYNIRAPQDHDLTTASDFIGQFTGIPNNGNIPTVVAAGKWNMIGNPYPSAISAAQFLAENDGVGALYFWAHANLPVNDGTDIYYRYKDDFVTFNDLGTAGPAPFDGYIAAAQGFIIKAPTATINFNNGQRRSGNNTKFFKTAESTVEKYRLWLKFANTTGDFKQILVGYAQGATNSLDANFDATSMAASGSVDFYSINSSKKLVIQGRAWPFVKTDVVTFGYMAASKGDYIISIDKADGIFNNDQEVFLQDKTTGKMTNLRLENYKFTSEAGTFNSRFVIRYVNTTLGTDDFESLENSVLVAVKDRIIKITSSQESIKEVNIFNIGAQLLYNKNNVNSSELQISNLHSSDQALLVKITLENGHSFTKKIIFSNL
ncbi:MULTISPECIES: T9SS sorting signal type C domain-containing protein [Flavobacterium]|uniref:T9SS sorting signal type C domain-containing protein n=1 Tax=Flavobacterium TaxID=237 RepID=UPI0011837C10|nr:MULTISPECIES: T9SS sorting signal type C domain-containing protein [Flavobacterium]MCR4033184.1 T9SS sorting signal type C domain-containing protein [Flavobacterium panacis]